MSTKQKIGEVRAGRIPVICGGQVVGNVGPTATAATVKRFGCFDADLRRFEGRTCWIGYSRPLKQPAETAAHKAARGSVKPRPGIE